MDILVILLTAGLFIAGVAGTALPLVPGTPLIFAGALLYAWHSNFARVGWPTLLFLLILTGLSQVMEPLASLIGAKKYGAKSSGLWGAFLGGILGLLVGGIFGLIIGPFVGAFVLEMIRGRNAREAFDVGFGTLIGFLGGMVGKILIALLMIAVFLIGLIH
jgi:uncharacterized protein YqgC (DUF456 family)